MYFKQKNLKMLIRKFDVELFVAKSKVLEILMPQILRRKGDRIREEVFDNNATSLIRQVEAEVVLDLDVSFLQGSKEVHKDRLCHFTITESFNGRALVGITLCHNDGEAILVHFLHLMKEHGAANLVESFSDQVIGVFAFFFVDKKVNMPCLLL